MDAKELIAMLHQVSEDAGAEELFYGELGASMKYTGARLASEAADAIAALNRDLAAARASEQYLGAMCDFWTAALAWDDFSMRAKVSHKVTNIDLLRLRDAAAPFGLSKEASE